MKAVYPLEVWLGIRQMVGHIITSTLDRAVWSVTNMFTCPLLLVKSAF